MNTRQENEEAPIFQAIRQNNAVKVQKLLKANPADAGLRDKEHNNPASLAFKLGHWQCMEALLQHKKHSINSKKNSVKVFKELISAKQYKLIELLGFPDTVNESDDEGNTPLHFVVQLNDEKLTSLLLAQGANPHVKNHQSISPLECACQLNYGNIALQLIKHGIDKKNSGTALLLAIQNQNKILVKKLLEKGADANQYDCSKGNIFIYEVLKTDNPDILRFLLQFMNLETIDITQEGKTPVMLAYELGATKCLDLINTSSSDQLTPLILQPDYVWKTQKAFLEKLLSDIKSQTWWIKKSDWSLLTYKNEKFEAGKKWISGYPEHIDTVKKHLDHGNFENPDVANNVFFEVAKIFFGLRPYEGRYHKTIAFDEKIKREICNVFTQCNQPVFSPASIEYNPVTPIANTNPMVYASCTSDLSPVYTSVHHPWLMTGSLEYTTDYPPSPQRIPPPLLSGHALPNTVLVDPLGTLDESLFPAVPTTPLIYPHLQQFSVFQPPAANTEKTKVRELTF